MHQNRKKPSRNKLFVTSALALCTYFAYVSFSVAQTSDPTSSASSNAPAQSADAAPAAPAASTPSAAAPSASVSEVVVTGIRRSLQSAEAIKKNAGNIVDAISAEDIGSFPDQNLAESLQRITGIQITYNRGEGQDISIRGLDPKFAHVVLNGNAVTSISGSGINNVGTATVGRNFDYTVLSSDFVSSLRVYKSSTADMEEGGLAGTVDVVTLHPLDLPRRKLSLNVEGVINEYNTHTGPHAVGIYADQFLDRKLGILVGYDYSKRYVDSQIYTNSGLEHKVESAYSPAGAADFVNGVYSPYTSYRAPFIWDAQNDYGDRERTNVIGSIQYRPIPGLEFKIDTLASRFYSNITTSTETVQEQLAGNPLIKGGTVVGSALSSTQPFNNDYATSYTVAGKSITNTPVTGILSYIDRNGVYADNWTKYDRELTNMFSFTPTIDYKWRNFSFEVLGGYNDSKKTSNNYGMDSGFFANAYIDARTDFGDIPSFGYDRGSTALNPAQYLTEASAFSGTAFNQPQTMRNTILSATATWKPIANWLTWLTKVEVGIKATDNDYYHGDQRLTVTSAQLAALTGEKLVTNTIGGGSGISTAQWLTTYGGSSFLGAYLGGSTFPKTYLAPNLNSFLAEYPVSTLAALPNAVTANLPSVYNIGERDNAAFIRGDFAFLDGKIQGNAGVRLVQTEQAVSGHSLNVNSLTVLGTVIQSSSASELFSNRNYTYALPSFNAEYLLSSNKILRVAASQTVTRPDYSLLQPSVTLSYVAGTATTSNDNLKPYTSNNYDISLEWYITKEALITGDLFYKDISGYVITSIVPQVYNIKNIATGVTAPETFAASLPVNGSNTTVKGFEINYQQPFTFLPHPLDGFGVNINYTYTDPGKIQTAAGGQFLPLTNVSQDSYNLVGYYEKGPASVRMAYNYRSNYVIDPLSSRLDGDFARGYGELDVSSQYKVNKQLSLTLDGVNLTNAAIEQYDMYNFGRGYEVDGRTVRFGARMVF